MRQFTLQGRIRIFKTLAVSKVIHPLLITELDNNTIDFLFEIQKNFIGHGKKEQIQFSQFCQ